MLTDDLVSVEPDSVWRAVEAHLDRDPFGEDFNTAHEACGRYAGQPQRLALTVRHEDGSAERWTYAELDRHAAWLAQVLAAAGLRTGDRVAGLLSRQVESWITALAAWRSGLVYVPLFGGFAADAIGVRLRDSGAAAVVVDPEYRHALAIAQCEYSLDPVVLVADRNNPKHRNGDLGFWKALEEASGSGPARATRITDPATLLFTSGTSGTPKACVMTHAAFVSVLPYAVSSIGVTGDTILFSTADPAWAFGLYTSGVAVMALGAPRVIYSGPFTPEAWHRVVREERITTLAMAPAALRRLAPVFAERGVPERLASVVAAGEPLTEAVATAWTATGAPPVRNGYGLSEVGMLLADTATETSLARPGMLTSVVPGFDVFLSDRQGEPVAEGQPGLIAVRRPRHQMSSGYANVPQLWRERWRDDVFITEDLAVRDDVGRWQVLGRDDDMIIASGHNISPVEVENAALRHGAVVEAAAVSYDDPLRGESVRLVAVLSADSDEQTLTAELKELVTEHVGRYAAPRLVEFWPALPRTAVGKLQRAAVKQQSSAV